MNDSGWTSAGQFGRAVGHITVRLTRLGPFRSNLLARRACLRFDKLHCLFQPFVPHLLDSSVPSLFQRLFHIILQFPVRQQSI
jgi:hypothetical protein